MTDLRDARDFTIWFDAWIEGKKRLTEKEVERLKQMVHAIPVEAAAVVPASKPTPPAKKAEPVHPYIIDEQGYVRNGKTKKRVLPSDVKDMVFDLRSGEGDLRTIIWADESTGLNGQDLTIVAAGLVS